MWNSVDIGSLCLRPETVDPRKRPNDRFTYIDIAGIDREAKTISSTSPLLGSDAPSRARQKVQENDILVSTVRPNLNAVASVPAELDGEVASTGFCVLRPCRSLLEPRYLYYFVQTRPFIDSLLQHVRGANYPAVTDGNVKGVGLPYPGLSEQRRIVEILDQADALRQQRRAADEKAKRILPALFHKMFGDPFSAATGFEVLPLGDERVAEINPRVDASLRDTTPVSFLPMSDVDEVWGRLRCQQQRLYSEVKRGFTPFRDGDVLFAKITPCMENGKAAIAEKLVNGYGSGSTEFHVLRPGPRATPEWLYSLLRLDSFRQLAKSNFTGSAGQQRVPTGFLKQLRVPVPPLQIQQQFARYYRQFIDSIDAATETRRKQEQLFGVLLHHAFTGELTARWREARKDQLAVELREQMAALEQTTSGPSARGRQRRAPR